MTNFIRNSVRDWVLITFLRCIIYGYIIAENFNHIIKFNL